ncbi:MAG: TRAM domain-containing protein [Candidatus Hydrogenedentales bacterium]|jgi:uncharacterized protein YacL
MGNRIIAVFFVIACTVMGALWAYYIINGFEANLPSDGVETRQSNQPEKPLPQGSAAFLWVLVGGISGAASAGVVLFALSFITQEMFERMFPAFVAIVLAMTLGYALARYVLIWWETDDRTLQIFLTSTFMLVFGFAGISLGLSRAARWESLLMQAVHHRQFEGANTKIVDTSVIIDGRIADVCKTGFVEGTLIIPRFVLRELQNIADSPDVLRRMRGRRGLDILKQLQQPDSRVKIEVVEDDPQDIHEVDGKLVSLARTFGGKILTNDLNLNKVAQIEGVDVLNLNDLANALKPAVLPDEQMHVKIVKEGKEATQGVGYLDDGTMVVVDGGKEYVGREVSVLVTSVLQTTAGRMIFTKLHSVIA